MTEREQERRPGGEGTRPRYRYTRRRKVCVFCTGQAKAIDYKDSVQLRRFLSERAKIDRRRRTGVCARHQRLLAQAIKRARHLAMLPFTPQHVREQA